MHLNINKNELHSITCYFSYSYLFIGLAKSHQFNAQNKENTEMIPSSSDRPVVDESSHTPEKEDTQESEQSSPSPNRDDLLSSMLNTRNRLLQRPNRVRRVSQSFDSVSELPHIQEE